MAVQIWEASVKRVLKVLCVGIASLVWAQDNSTDVKLQDHLRRAREAVASNKFNDALRELKQANKEQNNHCGVCYLEMANAYGKIEDLRNMQESAQKALAVAASDAVRAQAHYFVGAAKARDSSGGDKRFGAAEQEFRAAIQLDPQVSSYHLSLGLILLRQSQDEAGIQELQQYLKLAPDGPSAEMAKKMIADPRRARENYAPEFHFRTLQGENISSDQLAGKVVVLDFWATWCRPCRDSVPDLRDLQKKYSRDQMMLISISADEDEEKWRDFIAKQKMDWAQFWDHDGAVRQSFAVHAFPTYIVINEKGVITQHIEGEDQRQSVAYRLKAALASNTRLNAKN